MKSTKTFKTLNEQVNILKTKGLVINNEEYAKNIILRENYFFISGYRHVFLQENRRYIENTTFEELYSLFLFDRELRNILFKNILIIENNIKSIISYQLSKRYGVKEVDYLKPINFTNEPTKEKQVNDLLRKMKRQIRTNASQHSATMHYINNYGYIPMWVLVKVLSFGIVSEMYSILKSEDKVEIANQYNLDAKDLEISLPVLSNYRNLCAHEDIVFDNRTQRNIEDNVFHRMLNIEKNEAGEYLHGKNDLFALVILIKQLLSDDDFKKTTYEIKNALNNLEVNLKSVKIDKVLNIMGFPNNWQNLEKIEKREY